MAKYDLSTITRDQLCFMLGNAKNEMVEYSQCIERTEGVRNSIEGEKKMYGIDKSKMKGPTGSILLASIVFGLLASSLIHSSSTLSLIIGCLVPALVYIFVIRRMFKRLEEKHQKKIDAFEAQLPDLQKQEDAAFGKFYDVIEPYQFPRKYWYEYALIKMHEYVENMEADSWKEVAKLYNDHVHQLTMEENARQTFEEAKRQTEIAIETRNAARWAAAGAWASAAGVWRINSKL